MTATMPAACGDGASLPPVPRVGAAAPDEGRPPCPHAVADGLLERRDTHPEYGPETSGWCMPDGDDYGATTYVNVSFCPWCGTRLTGGA